MSMRLSNSRELLTLLLAGAAALVGCSADDTPATLGGTGSTSRGPATDTDPSAPPTSTSTTGTTGGTVDDTTGGDQTCVDGVRNQDETDVDCGGQTCPACGPGQRCGEASDCTSGVCDEGLCRPPACDDGVRNGDEIDVDCGGSCGPCGPNQNCLDDDDCASNVCADGVCVAASCRDGVQNGMETDVDCGGPSCPACPEGGTCQEHGDCATAFCGGDGTCLVVECVTNAHCSHLAGTCMVGHCNQTTNECEAASAFEGAPCSDGDPCTSSTCNSGMCGGPPVSCAHLDSPCAVGTCEEGVGCVVQPLDEGDSCSDGDPCTTNTTCTEGACTGGEPVSCSHLDAGCQIGVCNPFDGTCEVQVSPSGTPCDDATPCGSSGTCDAEGVCVSADLVPVFTEDFSDNEAGWLLDTEWEIGPTTPPTTCTVGQDPASDHTQAGDDGIAGVVIGGCSSTTAHPDYCMTSPILDTADVDGPLMFEYWRSLHSDWSSFMENRIDVFDGNAWVNVWTAQHSGTLSDPDWQRLAYELTAYKNADFRVRFCFNTSSGVWASASWNVDDVALSVCP
jgi:hypothetical protein